MSNYYNQHDILFLRHRHNPILTAEDWPYPANSVFNPGVTQLADGTTVLLCRVEDRTGFSHLTAARSMNGVDNWQIDQQPTFKPEPDRYPEEVWGVEDSRVTFVPELQKYIIAYTAYSRSGPTVSLAMTEDFQHFERLGSVMPPEDKDAALLPHRLGNRWALIHRPNTGFGAHMWISYSPDLRHWGNHKMIMEARRGGWWDANMVGVACPAIETAEGWLMIYHGVRQTASGSLCRLGLVLFDLETCEHVLLRCNQWVLGPETDYEREGDVDNVVFPCGYTLGSDGDALNLYYGSADSCIALVTTSIRILLDWLHQHGSSHRDGKTGHD